jgi:hypothetical protein
VADPKILRSAGTVVYVPLLIDMQPDPVWIPAKDFERSSWMFHLRSGYSTPGVRHHNQDIRAARKRQRQARKRARHG